MPFVVDEQPVGALGSCAAYPSLGVAVCARCPGRVLTGFTPSLAKIVSKALVNLASRSRIRKRKEPIRSPRSMIRCGPAARSTRRLGELSHPECARAGC